MTDTDSALPLAISMGEPAGIGTELLFKAYQHFAEFPAGKGPRFFVIDDPVRIEKSARALGVDVPIASLATPEDAIHQFANGLPVLPLADDALKSLQHVEPGRPNPTTAPAVIESITSAVAHIKNNRASGVVTLPIQKEALQQAGFAHPGHTEFLGYLTEDMPLPAGMVRGPVMLLTAGPFRVAPLTVHMPLKDVASAIAADNIVKKVMIIAQSLVRDYGIQTPRIAVAGLNPHAGEGGLMGTEEQEIIAPAIDALRKQGVDAQGPFPGDTMFHEEARAQYHAALTMYHDQGLIPIKTIAFYAAVNATLGLPIVRTSPDHGTALPLVGKGVARPDSLMNAIYAADRAAKARASFDAQQQA
ncbi:MAG: 4-hydroxythreonine-4-phosphate dehydrogenase PdxA [Pseudomonadota bacterium]